MSDQFIKALRFWHDNPVEAVKDWFGVTPESYQGDMLCDLFGPHHRVSAKSAHGVGKTTVEAWAGWIFLVTRPHARVPCTAPTQSQLKDILWPEFAKWHEKMPQELKQMWDISETHIRNKEFHKTWFAVARTSNKPENLQGFHNEHVLVLIDEASGVPQPVFEVIEGIMSNADEMGQEARMLMAGNPTQTAGEFYNAFHKNKQLYARYTISGETEKPSDPFGGKIYCSPRVSHSYRATMARKYGTTSPVYDVRVRGLFPSMADNVVVPLAWAEAAQFVKPPVFDPVADPLVLVMDVARFGGDETVLGWFRRNHCVRMQTWPKTSTNECVDILWEASKQSAVTVSRIVVDEPGIGGGVVDQARRYGLVITPYNGGAALSEANGDPLEDVRMFANRRSRDWWRVRRAMELGTMSIPEDETLVNQLASVMYQYNMKEKIQVESKGDMRDRLGEDASPDRADMIVMGIAPYYSLENAVPLELLDWAAEVQYGTNRPTAEMDFGDGTYGQGIGDAWSGNPFR